jgi:ASC-1-like (ASCH) protein
MKTYHNHRQEPYFTYLRNGQKTIEGRLQKGWYCDVEPGDHIHVYNPEETDSIVTQVKGVRKYPSIREMLLNEPLHKMLPDANDIEDGIKIYRQFYTEKDELKYGAVAIEVKVVEP